MSTLKWQLISELASPKSDPSIQIYQALWAEMIEAGLSIQQLGVLTLLARGPTRVSDVGTALNLRAPSTTGLLNRLEKKKLIERFHDPGDRRTVLCRLTPLGEGWITFLTGNMTRRIDELVNALSVQQIETLLDALRLLYVSSEQ